MIKLAHLLQIPWHVKILPKVKLWVLTLQENKIGDIGIEYICSFLKSNKTLEYLDISNTGFSYKGCV